jgi:hypothetical protein
MLEIGGYSGNSGYMARKFMIRVPLMRSHLWQRPFGEVGTARARLAKFASGARVAGTGEIGSYLSCSYVRETRAGWRSVNSGPGLNTSGPPWGCSDRGWRSRGGTLGLGLVNHRTNLDTEYLHIEIASNKRHRTGDGVKQ